MFNVDLRRKVTLLEDLTKNIRWCQECGDIYGKRMVGYEEHDDCRNKIFDKVASLDDMHDKELIEDSEYYKKTRALYDKLEYCPSPVEATNCKACDPVVKKRIEREAKVKEAIEVAESCPEAVLGIKDKKACKSEIDN